MKSSTKMATGAVVTVLGALVAITPRFLFPVCEYFGVQMMVNGSGHPMGCFYTARAAMLAGLLIAVIGVAIMLSKPQGLRTLSLVLAGAGAGVVLIPTVLFPICQNPDMHCNKGAKPMLIVLGLVNMMIAVWMAYGAERRSPYSEMTTTTPASPSESA